MPRRRACRAWSRSASLRVAWCFSSRLASEHGRTGRELGRVGQLADGVACTRWIAWDVLDEVARDVALRYRDCTGAGVAVPADDVERPEVDHRHHVVPAPAERAERRDDALVVLAVVRPVDRGCTGARAAEDAVLQPLVDLPHRTAGLRLDAVPRLGGPPELVVARACERLVDRISRAAALSD